MLEACRRHVDSGFMPKRVLDFGCGVGRVSIPLAERSDTVVGVDISPAMLEEADRNARAEGKNNLRWVLSDDQLSGVEGQFDLVHSCITFQHIDIPRGRRLFGSLISMISPGGVGAIQITYAKIHHLDTFGQPPERQSRALARSLIAPAEPLGDPEMQMNAYHLGELAFILQQSGIEQFHSRFTDHGGELGVFLFFGKPRK